MAMHGFDKEELQAPLAEINTTPLVDVMLVLLVIFLVTAPMLNNAIKLELPNETATQITEQKPITISLDSEGRYYWNDNEISLEDLKKDLQKIAKTNSKQPIHIRADIHATYGNLSHILANAQNMGLKNIGFITEPK